MLPNVERLDLGWASRLLRAELVAREEQEAEAACFVLAPERDEPGHLPNISQASDVDDEDHLACEDVERDVLARVSPGAQIGEGRHRVASQHGALRLWAKTRSAGARHHCTIPQDDTRHPLVKTGLKILVTANTRGHTLKHTR